MAIEAQGLEIQIGARTLLHPTNFHVAKGDKIGLVGRNGAGKTTLTRVITGDMLPTAGKVRVSGKLGYLPQDTHAADPEQTALDRMMSARDIASIIKRIRKAEKEMTDPDPDVMTKAMNRYDKAMQDFEKAGGYAAQSEATAMAASLGLPQEVMGQQLGTLSGGQRRRIELARILFSDADTLILDEPTNHLDADSIEWLRGYLKKYEGGLLDAMRFGQSDHIDLCDARGLQPVGECPARGHGGGDFLTGGNAVGVVLKAFEAGI